MNQFDQGQALEKQLDQDEQFLDEDVRCRDAETQDDQHGESDAETGYLEIKQAVDFDEHRVNHKDRHCQRQKNQ